MTNQITAFVDGHTADDLSGLFDPHEGLVLKHLLKDLDDDGWISDRLEDLLPTLRWLNSNYTNGMILADHLRRLEAGFDRKTRFFVNGMKVQFAGIFEETIETLFGENRSRYVTALRRKAFLRLAMVAMVSTWEGNQGIVHDGDSESREHPTPYMGLYLVASAT